MCQIVSVLCQNAELNQRGWDGGAMIFWKHHSSLEKIPGVAESAFPYEKPGNFEYNFVLRRRGSLVRFAAFHPDGVRILVASEDNTARIWEAPIATMSTKALMADACLRLHGLSKLTRDEMRLVGYAEDAPEIDVCADH